MLSLTDLQYFQRIAELQNMTKAAEELHVAQPALSRSVKNLERELGHPLFERIKGNRIQINEFGLTVYRWTQTILKDIDEMHGELEDISTGGSSRIRFAVCAGSPVIAGFMEDYMKLDPSARFESVLRPGESEWDLMIHEAIDEIHEEYTVKLMEERILVSMAKDHPLAAKETITIEDLRECSFVMLDQSKNLRKSVDEFLEKVGIIPKIIILADSPHTMHIRTNDGTGVCLMPEYTWPFAGYENTIRKPIADTDVKLSVYLTWNTKEKPNPATVAFGNYLQNHFREIMKDSGR